MKNKKTIIAIILTFSLLISSTIKSLAAESFMPNYQEEFELLDKKLVYRPCKGDKNDDCEKYLIRFEGVEPFADELKKFIKKNKYSNLKYNLEKTAIGTVGVSGIGAGLYFAPIGTSIATVAMGTALPLICAVRNEIIEPSGEAVAIMVTPGLLTGIKIAVTAFLAKQIKKMINWISGDKPIANVDRGLVGNTLNILCGDKTKKDNNEGLLEGFRRLIFGDIPDQVLAQVARKKVYSQILNDLKSQIKNRNFKNKDAVRVFINITDYNDPKSVVRFIKTAIGLDYSKLPEKYFENID